MAWLAFALICAMVIGWQNGGNKMQRVKQNPKLGVPKAKDPCSFIYYDLS